MNFEKAMNQSGSGKVLGNLYSALAQHAVGREVVMFASKK